MRIGRRPLAIGLAAAGLVVVAAIVVVRRGADTACYTGDPKTASAPADPALLAGALRVRSTGQAAIEIVNGEMFGTRTQVVAEPGGLLSFSGWAVDTALRGLPRAVLITVDGRPPRRADTCIARPDVARFFATPGYAQSGYAARLQIMPGVHDVAVEVLAADGRMLYTGVRSFELDGRASKRAAAPAFVQGGFTDLDGASIPPAALGGTSFSHPIGTDLLVAGWMIDRTYATPAAVRAVDVLIDGRVVDRAAYGAARPDIAAFVKLPDLVNTGFTARVLTDALAPGRHTLALRGIVAAGRPAMLTSTIALELTRRAPTAP